MVTLRYRPECLYLDHKVLFLYISLVLVVFRVRAHGGSLSCWTKCSDTTRGLEMCVSNKLPPTILILTGELFLNEQ